MRKTPPQKLEAGRIVSGPYGSRVGRMTGAFFVAGPCGTQLKIIANDLAGESEGWEHVSVSCEHRTPNWKEMCFVKDLFWEPEQLVVQFHPPESQYVNCHPFCLHLWRKENMMNNVPPMMLVGPKT